MAAPPSSASEGTYIRPNVAGGTFASLRVPTYTRFWVSGWTWNIARWLGLFSGSYLVFHRGGSTLEVQLVGVAYFAPMFLGGLAGGVLADRFDRRLLVIVQMWLLVLLSIALTVDIVAGMARSWHIYPAMLLLGCGSVSDMTCRRALISDLVGDRLLTNAFALESISMTGGTLFGNLAGGAAINIAGAGLAYTVMGVLCAIAALSLIGVRAPEQHLVRTGSGPLLRQLAAGIRYAGGNRALIGVLSVTVVMNGFFYTYVPLVPAFGKQLNVNAFWAGALGAAAGLGSMTGSFLIAALPGRVSRVRLYAGGAAVALAGIAGLTFTRQYPLAFLALVVAGIGTAGFAAMQATLVLAITPVELRGRAMGVLSMAIGTLPFGLFALGAVAENTGMLAAVRGSGIAGLVVLAVCWASSRSLRESV